MPKQPAPRPHLTGASLLVLLACCGGGQPAPTLSAADLATLDELKSSLAGQPAAATDARTKALNATLNVEDWGYLIHASWPADSAAALADPALRKAMHAGAAVPGRSPRASQSQTFNPPAMQAFYSQAMTLMQQANFAGQAGSPAAVSALVGGINGQLASGIGTTPLPSPSAPVDITMANCGVSFWNGTGASSQNCDPAYFCCKGELDFPGGKLNCLDNTSCKGSGNPPGSLQTGSSSTPANSDDPCNVTFGFQAPDPGEQVWVHFRGGQDFIQELVNIPPAIQKSGGTWNTPDVDGISTIVATLDLTTCVLKLALTYNSIVDCEADIQYGASANPQSLKCDVRACSYYSETGCVVSHTP